MSHHPNSLLARLSASDLEALSPHLSVIKLDRHDVLGEPFRSLDKVYFPHSGILSFVVELPGGGGAETGVVGKDGAFGGIQALGHGVCLNRVVVQIPGEASVMPLAPLRKLLAEMSSLREAVVRFEQFFLAQAQQTAACNAHHPIQQKLCKWLGRMYDLTGADLPLTQEFIAIMLGVRRTSVTDAAIALHQLEIIDYNRGKIRIRDVPALERNACECLGDVRGHFRRLFHSETETE